MNIKPFLSNHTYLVLPTKARPKVYLPIADSITVNRAFELYNPFSKKAKLLKGVARFLCSNMRPIARILFWTVRGSKSALLAFLENRLSKNITCSVYIATAKDKVVLQLQDNNGLIGYLKFPISDIGKNRLLNEQRAIELLSAKNIVPPLLLKGEYENTPFIIQSPINGSIGNIDNKEYTLVLNTLKTNESFTLQSHPRVIQLRTQLSQLNLNNLLQTLDRTVQKSSRAYSLVYEHGDFAPWNLVKTAKGIVPFDFEYFEEEGIEHFDELKYHFQEQHLLHKKTGKNLILAIESKIDIDEFNTIFTLFLLKEIALKKNNVESIEEEISLLKQL